MLRRNPLSAVFCFAVCIAICAARPAQGEPTPEDYEFFEAKVRPLLAKHCFSCHSRNSKPVKGGLMLDTGDGLAKGGDSGKVVEPGQADKSLLVRSVRYEAYEMPPDGKLPRRDIETLVRWVNMGAPWPKEQVATLAKTDEIDWSRIREDHWAWRAIGSPKPPQVSNTNWPAGAIDHFILSRLESKGMQPAPTVARNQLIRRVYFDLLGLPPTPDELDELMKDNRSDWYVRLINRLLDKEQYGERWGRHWLDVARYSDGFGGFLDNKASPHAWQYRDWVVHALNADMPYDEFVRLQIAGDLIDPVRHGAATGFFALGPTYVSDGGDPDSKAQAKSETLDDRVDTLSRGFLALTVACARCHDHKFDPIPTMDYYSLAGIFNNTKKVDLQVALWEPAEKHASAQKFIAKLNAKIEQLRQEIERRGQTMTDADRKQIGAWQAQVEQYKRVPQPNRVAAHGLGESGSGDMKVALRGNLRKPGPVAPRRFLRLVAGKDPNRFQKGSGRLDLATAVTDPKNPLTARVIVNRIWMHHFGKALVRSPSNFGTLGQPPTHPALLDWLARHLIDSGWSIKQLHRTIMLSSTYRMSSRFDRAHFELDGDNKLLWRMNPRRLDVEAWRDGLLSVTGELDKKLGGPPTDDLEGSRRRTLYAKTSRNGDRFRSDTFLRLFDFPLPRATIAERPVSTVPQQFLFLMNSPFMVNRAKALSKRLHDEFKTDPERIQRAYVLLYGRAATDQEMSLALSFLNETVAEPKPVAKSPKATTKDQDILVEDFEGDSYGDWKVEGQAFGPRPAQGTLNRQMVVSGFLGRGLVNSFYNGDATTGKLTSPPFRIQRTHINFLVGGGKYPGKTCINLLVDGKVVRTATGPNDRGGGSEKLNWQYWDVGPFMGRQAVIQIVDDRSGGWGHINVDHIVQSSRIVRNASQSNAAPRPRPKLSPWIQYAQVLLSANEFMHIR